MLQKTLFRQWPLDPAATACDAHLISDATSDTNQYLAHTPPHIRSQLLHSISGYLRFMVIIPEMAIEHHISNYADLDPILLCYAQARIKSDPLYFMRDVAVQFWNLLTYSTFVSQAEHDAISQYLIDHPPPLPPTVPRHDLDYLLRAKATAELHMPAEVFQTTDFYLAAPHARPQILSWGLRFFQIVAASIMALAILASIIASLLSRPPNKLVLIIAIIGTAFYADMLITALVEIALPRYVFPLWPLFCTAAVTPAMSAALFQER